METLLSKCAKLMIRAHKGQVDKALKPYHLHPMAVCNLLEGESTDVQCIALLHDVMEDSFMDKEFLVNKGIPENIISSLLVLTKKKDEKYLDYISRVLNSGDINALKVKLADVTHNLSREESIPPHKKNIYIMVQKTIIEMLEK